MTENFNNYRSCDFDNDKICDLNNDEICDFDNDKICDLNNDEICDLNNDEICDFDNDKICDLNNDEICDFDNDKICDFDEFIENNGVDNFINFNNYKIINHKDITNHGFALLKKYLSLQDVSKIKKDLIVKPKESNFNLKVESFKIFKETSEAYYVPRYYGIKHFGDKKFRHYIDKSFPSYINDNINLEFKGNLRSDQQLIAEECLNKIKNIGGGIMCLHTGYGKCFAKNTEVLMYDGSVKKIQDIQVGDSLINEKSEKVTVESLARGSDHLIEIIQSNNFNYTVNSSHILTLLDCDGKLIDIPVKEYIEGIKYNDEYICKLKGAKYSVDLGNYDNVYSNLNLLSSYDYSKNVNDQYFPKFKNFVNSSLESIKNSNLDNLKINYYIFGLYKNKYDTIYIPQKIINILNYISNITSVKSRRIIEYAFLNGVFKNKKTAVINNKYLLKKLTVILNSLGIKNHLTFKNNSAQIHADLFKFIERNKISQSCNIAFRYVKFGNYYGFTLNNKKGRFLLSNFSVTHNTVLAIYIACRLNIKTLVIVNQDFLIDQWESRIKMFSNAKTGIIKAGKLDTFNKDIVIGSIHSISKKNYHFDTFSNFSLVIYDECHHVPAKTFSSSLFKTGFKYTIGLSATFDRTDGLVKIASWHLGDIISKVERKGTENVYVKSFQYISRDEKFCEKTMRMKDPKTGNIKKELNISGMTSDICNIEPRNKFICKIINQIINLECRKVLVLSARREHLKILKGKVDSIIINKVNKGVCLKKNVTTGYCMGGMDKTELELSYKADVIFATFSMAAEALDIPDLNTVILSTPKKNIIQAVGRILRKPISVGDVIPMIIDIHDELSIFDKWGSKRMDYYFESKFKYRIFKAFEDNVITIKDYMINENIVAEKVANSDDFDVRKEFIINLSGLNAYNDEKNNDFTNEKLEYYTYEPKMSRIITDTYLI